MAFETHPWILGSDYRSRNFYANFELKSENNSGPSLPRYGQYMPIIMLVVATFTLIEAAGAADEYPALKGSSKVSQLTVLVGNNIIVCVFHQVEKTTAAICQRTLLIILPLTFASFVCGTFAEYEQV